MAIITSFASSVASWFQQGGSVQLYLILVAADIITGTFQAFKQRRVSSEISRDGLIRKAGMIFTVMLGLLLSPYAHRPLGIMFATAFCLPEGLSIIENLTLIGVPLPKALTQYFIKVVTGGANGAPDDTTTQKLESPE